MAVPDRVCSAASIVSTAATRIPRARRNAQTLGVRARPAPAISTVKDRHLPLAQCRQTLRCSNRLRRHSTARSRSSAANRSQCRDTLRPAACGPAQCELRRVCYAAETVQVVASAAVRLCRRLASPGVAWQRPESQGPIRCGHVPWPGTRDPCSCWPLVGRVDLQSRPLALVTVDSCPTPLSLMLAPVWPRPSSGCPSAATPARAV
eukprot:COSAG06_NODE_4613_length_4100_cov_14.926268_2_plen_206_part_00